MAAMVYANKTCSNCCPTAAACSSARIIPILDTAIALVVSICVCLLSLRITM